MKLLMRLLPVLCGVFLLAGCSYTLPQTRNMNNAEHLRVGMTKAEVLALMGKPVEDEVFTRPDVWFYFVEMVWFDFLTTEDECFPLVFKDGKLIGWGNEFYAKHRLVPGQASTIE